MKYLSILLILVVAACGTDKSQSDLRQIERDGYTLLYPNDWSELQNEIFNTSLLIQPDSITNKQFKSNASVMIQDLKGTDMDLERYVELTLEQSPMMITDYKLLNSEPYKGGHSLILTGRQGQSDLKWHQYFWVKNGNGYILTYTALQSESDPHLADFKSIAESFNIK